MIDVSLVADEATGFVEFSYVVAKLSICDKAFSRRHLLYKYPDCGVSASDRPVIDNGMPKPLDVSSCDMTKRRIGQVVHFTTARIVIACTLPRYNGVRHLSCTY